MVFRYRKWRLRDTEVRDGERIEGVTLVARCEHDAVLRGEQGDVFINIKACNEWDSKVSMSKVLAVSGDYFGSLIILCCRGSKTLIIV